MARILYGVMGNTNGHVMRTLSIAPRMTGDEFCFVAGGRAAELLQGRYPIHEVPVLRTKHRNQRLDLPGTIGQIIQRVGDIPSITSGILDLIQSFQPDLIISDREFFLPLAAKQARVECISVDHTHVLKACHYHVPPELRFNWALTMANDYCLFDFTQTNLVVSFFDAPKRPGRKDELYGAVVRPHLSRFEPRQGNHIFVYMSIHGFEGLIESLRSTGRPIVAYGSAFPPGKDGNVEYRPFDENRIFEDLSTCAYAVINGGHNLVSEALHFGKPILCFPIAGLFEQYLNASHVRDLNYGDFTYDYQPSLEFVRSFESRLGDFAENIRKNFREGTEPLINRIRQLATRGVATLKP